MKKAIIIGASSGIGREVALLLLQKGWHCGIAARRQELLEDIKALFPDRVETATIDVNQADAPERLGQLIQRLGGLDLYFHASGIGHQNRQLEPAIEMNTVQTNAMGFTRMLTTAFNHMAANGGGHIAAITSIAGTKGLGPAPAYSATKAFQNTYIQSLEQLANARRLNIRFTDIRPGFVDTPLIADGNRYPITLKPQAVAKEIVAAIEHRRHMRIIDWRWRIITAGWRRVPRWLWRRLKL